MQTNKIHDCMLVGGEVALSCVVAVLGAVGLSGVSMAAKSIVLSPAVVAETARPMNSSGNVEASVGVTVVVASGCT